MNVPAHVAAVVCAFALAAGCGAQERVPGDRLEGHGLRALLPAGWDGRIHLRAGDPPPLGPVLHAASFPLPGEDDDAGTAARAAMREDDVLVVILEYPSGYAGPPNFPPADLPLGLDDLEIFETAEGMPLYHSQARKTLSIRERAFDVRVEFGSPSPGSASREEAEVVLAGFDLAQH